MPVRAECPECGLVLRLRSANALGHMVICPDCGEHYRVEELLEIVEEPNQGAYHSEQSAATAGVTKAVGCVLKAIAAMFLLMILGSAALFWFVFRQPGVFDVEPDAEKDNFAIYVSNARFRVLPNGQGELTLDYRLNNPGKANQGDLELRYHVEGTFNQRVDWSDRQSNKRLNPRGTFKVPNPFPEEDIELEGAFAVLRNGERVSNVYRFKVPKKSSLPGHRAGRLQPPR